VVQQEDSRALLERASAGRLLLQRAAATNGPCLRYGGSPFEREKWHGVIRSFARATFLAADGKVGIVLDEDGTLALVTVSPEGPQDSWRRHRLLRESPGRVPTLVNTTLYLSRFRVQHHALGSRQALRKGRAPAPRDLALVLCAAPRASSPREAAHSSPSAERRAAESRVPESECRAPLEPHAAADANVRGRPLSPEARWGERAVGERDGPRSGCRRRSAPQLGEQQPASHPLNRQVGD